MKGLQTDSSSPLYHQLMQRISADIERGTYPTGSRFRRSMNLNSCIRSAA